MHFLAEGVIILCSFRRMVKGVVLMIFHAPYYHGYIRNAYCIYDNDFHDYFRFKKQEIKKELTASASKM